MTTDQPRAIDRPVLGKGEVAGYDSRVNIFAASLNLLALLLLPV